MAWQMERNLLCPGCGLPRDETMAKERQFGYTATPVRCHACKARSQAAVKFQKDGGKLDGLTFRVEPVD